MRGEQPALMFRSRSNVSTSGSAGDSDTTRVTSGYSHRELRNGAFGDGIEGREERENGSFGSSWMRPARGIVAFLPDGRNGPSLRGESSTGGRPLLKILDEGTAGRE